MNDSRIQSKTPPFSFENGLVWTGPLYIYITDENTPLAMLVHSCYITKLYSMKT